MTCLISVGNVGKYAYLKVPFKGGEHRYLDLNSGALFLKEKNNGL